MPYGQGKKANQMQRNGTAGGHEVVRTMVRTAGEGRFQQRPVGGRKTEEKGHGEYKQDAESEDGGMIYLKWQTLTEVDSNNVNSKQNFNSARKLRWRGKAVWARTVALQTEEESEVLWHMGCAEEK